MFLAPITLPRDAETAPSPSKPSSKSARVRAESRRVARASRHADAVRPERMIERAAVKRVLLAWLVLGCAIALLFPQSLFSRSAGASAAFWLVGAPLVDLAWLSRARLHATVRGALARARPHAQARRI